MGLEGKTLGVDGAMAPRLWAEGQFDPVLHYVAQDVQATLQVALAAERLCEVRWVTQRGTIGNENLTGGWMTVPEATTLPLPDVSWMDRPMPRSHFTEWLNQ